MAPRSDRSSPPIPVIDLFAGPGGLGEGFSASGRHDRSQRFRIHLSVEKDPVAHRTLALRAFLRQFAESAVPETYYRYLRGEIVRDELFQSHSEQAARARSEAWCATLGDVPVRELDERIRLSLSGARRWALVGGPPCQAYSLVGRSRVGGIDAADGRVYLYREYLRIVAEHRPPVFVMENVRGLLSAKVVGEYLFDRIRRDLSNPVAAVHGRARTSPSASGRYRLVPLSADSWRDDGATCDPRDFVVRAEDFGVPQARHRVIILGVREDIELPSSGAPLDRHPGAVSVQQVIRDLPQLRSGLSRDDSPEAWLRAVRAMGSPTALRAVREAADPKVVDRIELALAQIRPPSEDRGSEFIPGGRMPRYRSDWFYDARIGGVCNHSARGHIPEDLHRYLFAACFTEVHSVSPDLSRYPTRLLPAHGNAADAVMTGKFADRFRVQVSSRPGSTVTCHISKDGHYYIHYDPKQCRSLTVREAARIQTFPDNYFFEGSRTAQYQQVGNAVPPLLAVQIASAVRRVLAGAKLD